MSMNSYTITDFGPSDLLTNTVLGKRRAKTSSEISTIAASLNGLLYAISGSYSVPAGEKLAMNISLAADSVLHTVVTNRGMPVEVMTQHATGSADGIFSAVNTNLCSDDSSPSQGQLYYSATPSGGIVASGYGEIQPSVIACEDSQPSIVVTNDTADTQSVKIFVLIEEIGARNPSFGLTPSTLLQPTTEMSLYG